MMKGSDIGILEKKAKLFNEWEWFTSIDEESIESYYHRFSKLINDFKRNKYFLEKIVSNLKFLNNLQPGWSRHVTIVHQTRDFHEVDYTQLYDFLKYNQVEVNQLSAERLARAHDPLALMANFNNPYNYIVFHQEQPSQITYMQQPQPNNNYIPQPSFNANYMQQPMPNPEDITDLITAMNMELVLIAKSFKLNYSTTTREFHLTLIIGRLHSGNVGNQNGYNVVQNVRNQVVQNAVQNLGIQNVGNQNELIVVSCIANNNVNPTRNGNVVAAWLKIEEVKENCILMANFQQTSTSEEAKFVRDFKSLAKEADESLAKHKALEYEIESLLKAVFSQDIMSIVQSNSVVYTSNLQTELEPYIDMEQKIERLQAQLEDFKGKSQDTPCVSYTLDPLSHKLKNENVELEFKVLNYAKENEHLKITYKNLFDSINVTRAQTKTITDSLQQKLHDMIYENAKLRAQLFDKVSKQKDTTKDNTAKTKRPQPRSNTKTDRVPSASKSNCIKNKEVEVEERPRNLLLSKNNKHMSPECNNIKLAIRNDKSEVFCAIANVSKTANKRKHKPKGKKTKKLGSKERLEATLSPYGFVSSNESQKYKREAACSGDCKRLLLLYLAMYDDYIGGQPSAAIRTAPAAQEPQDVDELKPKQKHVQQQDDQPPLQTKTVVDNVSNAILNRNTFRTKDYHLEQVIGEPLRPVLTRNLLRTEGKMCIYALTVSTMELKNVKEPMTDPTRINLMQEELLQFKRLDVWVLVHPPDNITSYIEIVIQEQAR
nr:hypothetical protein [Tanacetum cinerariifolium]